MGFVGFLRRNLLCISGTGRWHSPYDYDPGTSADNLFRCGSVDSSKCNCHSGQSAQLDHNDQLNRDSHRPESTDPEGRSTPVQNGLSNECSEADSSRDSTQDIDTREEYDS
jgi:hypothetical protein